MVKSLTIGDKALLDRNLPKMSPEEKEALTAKMLKNCTQVKNSQSSLTR